MADSNPQPVVTLKRLAMTEPRWAIMTDSVEFYSSVGGFFAAAKIPQDPLLAIIDDGFWMESHLTGVRVLFEAASYYEAASQIISDESLEVITIDQGAPIYLWFSKDQFKWPSPDVPMGNFVFLYQPKLLIKDAGFYYAPYVPTNSNGLTVP